MENFDFYKSLASKIFNKPESEITVSERRRAKLSFFRAIYCGQDENTALILNLFTKKKELEMYLKEAILNRVRWTFEDFSYYDREDDTEVPPGTIGKAIEEGTVTIDEMVNVFKESLQDYYKLGKL